MIGFHFTSNWLIKLHKIFWPITKRSNAKPKQLQNFFRHSSENPSIVDDIADNIVLDVDFIFYLSLLVFDAVVVIAVAITTLFLILSFSVIFDIIIDALIIRKLFNTNSGEM